MNIVNLLFSLLAFVLSMVCGFVFIPQILNFCKKRNLYDIPNTRKVHKNAIPRLGGISFLPSMVIATIVAIAVMGGNFKGEKLVISSWSLSFVIGLLIVYSVGLIDDIIGLSARTKFIAQIIAAILLPLSFLYLNNGYGFLGIHDIPYYIGAPLTVFVLVFIMNAINLIDGIDGLSSSLSMLALAGFYYCFFHESIWVYCILIAGLMGVLVSFFYFNFFGNSDENRKIFMGDSGSLTLGYILGTLFVKFAMDNPNVMPFRIEALLLPYTLLIIPVFDVVRVIVVRILHRKPIFDADKNHIHHKLMRTNLTQHQTLGVIIGLAVLFIILNYSLCRYIPVTVIVGIDIILYIVYHLVLDHFIRKAGRQPFAES
ncbi:MAG: undecaprenyl/decaprenyl-phosphate alpha-N-acetylglucosaminyl 1-phosphate transferase [Prevotella sp.]|nr:undecaprenyl/decaprenyl-phosphate alpha-N-acetylglucosaminyl 1-phosphate transferase [Prevotella sp.]